MDFFDKQSPYHYHCWLHLHVTLAPWMPVVGQTYSSSLYYSMEAMRVDFLHQVIVDELMNLPLFTRVLTAQRQQKHDCLCEFTLFGTAASIRC